MNRYFIIILASLAAVISISTIYFYESDYYQCHEEKEVTIFPDQIVSDNGNTTGVGNTGLTYDKKQNLLVHARYNFEHSDILFFTDYDGNVVDKLDVSHVVDHIQGSTYDWDTDSFWVWGVTPGMELKYLGKDFLLANIDRGGKVLLKHQLPSAINIPGQLAYAGSGKIWIKPDTATQAILYNTESRKFDQVVNTKIAGEGIAYDKITGLLWLHDGKEIAKFDPENSTILMRWPSPVQKEQSEGMAIDGYGRVWVAADEGLKGVPGGNKVWAAVCSREFSIGGMLID